MIAEIKTLEAPMNKFTLALFAVSIAVPVHAQTAVRQTEEALIIAANAIPFCEEGKTATAARYRSETDDTIEITCDDDVVGFVPPAAGLGLGGGAAAGAALAGLAIAAAAAGGGGATPSTLP